MSVIPYRVDPQTSVTQPDSDAQEWMDRRTAARQDRKRYEPVWHLCQAYIANRQWVGWSKRTSRIVTEPNPQDRERHTVNVLTQYLMTNVGKLIADDWLPRLFFRSETFEDEEYSKVANLATKYAWYEEIDAEGRLYEAFIKMCTYGIAGIQAGYDPLRGPIIQKGVPFQNGKPLLDPEQARSFMADSYANGSGPVDVRDVRGQLSWSVLSPFNILPPPGVEQERNFPWLITERPVPLDRVKAMYPKAANLTEQDLATVDLLGLRDVTDDDVSSPGKLKGHVLFSEGYEAPTRKNPEGRAVCFVKDVILETKPLPINIKGEPHFGIRFFKYHTIPDRFWPVGLIEPGIGPQRQRNRSRSQYIEMKDRAGLGRIYARPGSIDFKNNPKGKVMEVVEVRVGNDFPQETTGPGPGAWLAQDVQMHDADLDRVMGMREVTLGQAPGGVSAYSAMALLAEQDDKRFGPIIKKARLEVVWLVKYMLHDMRKYWPPNKVVTLLGDEGKIESSVFNAASLPPDYYVEVGSGAPTPRSQAAEIQKIFDLFDRSISSGQRLPMSWLWDSLQAGKALPLPDDLNTLQHEKAELENLTMAHGSPVPVGQADDHQLHIQVHTEAVIEHEPIPGDEMIVQLIQAHIQAHQMALQQQQSAALSVPQMQGPMGALGGAPTPGAPQAAGMPAVPPAFVNRLSPLPPNVR